MTFSLFSAPEREPSQFVGFAGNRIDRQSENRSDDVLEKAFQDPPLRIMQSRAGRLYLKLPGEAFDPYFTLAEARAMGAKLDHAILLGMSSAGPVVMAPGSVEPEELPDGIKAIDYRSIYTQGLIGEESLGELAQGAALLAWHHNHRFCGRCGARTEMRIGGYKRVCSSCAAEHFPRTDPVAIMLAVRPEKCLLGRSPHFAPGMYSALAGFIEPGETIENAVRRETFEEAGIRLGRVAYHASQPWPFPYSLMIGCFGEALDDDIRADSSELEDCRWFSRAEVQAMLRGENAEGIVVPPSGAIAHHLIRAWATAG
ncbi:NAD(+) diphosphatase [Aquamicrobium sp. LC103]|uniref:NAD(+) diphosphatase n=1 Tax=Aquamicrobium sp. LC103 TaxID=1120658 RepID=UPI00063EB138|nr:NAD(+) diphosphatase [Aquamicrobium sp. LC103]TKT74976.1 NAD(+) diphosphatase [Aquamicrobium sp. LC103]